MKDKNHFNKKKQFKCFIVAFKFHKFMNINISEALKVILLATVVGRSSHSYRVASLLIMNVV